MIGAFAGAAHPFKQLTTIRAEQAHENVGQQIKLLHPNFISGVGLLISAQLH